MALGRKTCVLVLGMHRSGTSALARVISLHGASLPRSLLGASPGNELGHWEPERIVQLHDRLLDELASRWDDWGPIDMDRLGAERLTHYTSELGQVLREDFGNAAVFVLKDPRTARLMPLWRSVAAAQNIDLKVALIFRNPLEVVDSLQARKLTWSEDYTRIEAALLWLRYTLDAETACRSMTRVTVSYETLLNDWRSCVEKLSKGLGLTLLSMHQEATSEVERFLSHDQRHHARTVEEVREDPCTRIWVAGAYEAMRGLEAAPEAPAALRALDRLRDEFERAAPLIRQLAIQKRENSQRVEAKMQKAIEHGAAEIRDLAALLAARQQEVIAREQELASVRQMSLGKIVWRKLRWQVSRFRANALYMRVEISRIRNKMYHGRSNRRIS